MTFVVDNLQQYFMADVLESQFSMLKKKMSAADDFEDLGQAHDVFVANVTEQTFANNKPVSLKVMEQ